MLRGQPKTPPSGDYLGVLNYHLNFRQTSENKSLQEDRFSSEGLFVGLQGRVCRIYIKIDRYKDR